MKYSKQLTTLLLFVVTLLLSCEEGMNVESPLNSDVGISIQKSSDVGQPLITEYSFNGQEGDPIPLETAQRWTANFQTSNPTGTKAHFFGFEIIRQILAEEGCVGIRMYYALDDNGKRQLVLVGTNAAGENLIPKSLKLDGEEEFIVADASYPCPSFCPQITGL